MGNPCPLSELVDLDVALEGWLGTAREGEGCGRSNQNSRMFCGP
jgi:hypothetical protein